MYSLHLIFKYLRKKRIAWVSMFAVMLCTAMVLVVISVMGGWLTMFRASFQGLSGDVVVRTGDFEGFPFYERMIEKLEADPRIDAAVPRVRSYALVEFSVRGGGKLQQAVTVIGVPMDRIDEVTSFHKSLYLNNPDITATEKLTTLLDKYQPEIDRFEKGRDSRMKAIESRLAAGELSSDEAAAMLRVEAEDQLALVAYANAWAANQIDQKPPPSFDLPWDAQAYRDFFAGIRRPRDATPPENFKGLIVGTGVIGIRPDADGEIDRWYGLGPTSPLQAKLVTLDVTGGIDQNIADMKEELTLWVVDNSRSGVFQEDNNTVYVDFDLLQNTLGMVPLPMEMDDRDTGELLGTVPQPKRTGELHVALADGVDLRAGRAAVEQIVQAVMTESDPDVAFTGDLRVETWEDQYSEFLGAVEKEKALVTVLFGFISIVAIFLILCVFYMIVKEKTRDIGILKSVGATQRGIASIFLGYGAAIGVVGSLLGLGVGFLIVHYINEIHDFMAGVLGIEVWNAQTYVFDTIPNTMNPVEATIIIVVAIVSSTLGAVVPALLAAGLKPVEALRFE